MNITTLTPEYFDETAVRLPPVKLYRLDTHGTRCYYTYDAGTLEIFPGVTGLLDAVLPTPEWLVDWKVKMGLEKANQYRDERATYGTLMHTLIAKLLRDGRLALDTIDDIVRGYCQCTGYVRLADAWTHEVSKDVLAFAAWAQETQFVPLGIEVPLCSRQLRVASCIDLWGYATVTENRKTSRKMVVIDLKSGKNGSAGNEHREIQVAYYEAFIKENYPEFQDDPMSLYNWSPKDWQTSPTSHFTNQTGKHTRRELELLSELYHLKHDIGSRTRLALAGEISLQTPVSDNYTICSYRDMLAGGQPV